MGWFFCFAFMASIQSGHRWMPVGPTGFTADFANFLFWLSGHLV